MTPETEAAIRAWSATAEGWCQVEHALDMAQLIIEEKPSIVVEVGVFSGGSMIPQALALKENGHGKIFGIDPWSHQAALEQMFVSNDVTPIAEAEQNKKWWSEVNLDQMLRLCMEGIWNHDLESHAIVIRARSQDCAELFPLIDIANIDGNHSELASCRDVELYLPRIKSGGFLHFDDCHWQSTQHAVRMIEEACILEKDRETYRIYRKL